MKEIPQKVNPLDSRQLNAFVTVAQTGSFAETARRLCVTQLAISHSMYALESKIGCRLLARMGKTITLTEAGEALLHHALLVRTAKRRKFQTKPVESQPSAEPSELAYTQIRAKIQSNDGRELSHIVEARPRLPAAFKAAILAIVNSSPDAKGEVAISPEPSTVSLLSRKRKMFASNHFLKSPHRFLGLHLAILIHEQSVVY